MAGGCHVIHGDCTAVLAAMDGDLFDACVTDPPYHLTSIVKRFGKKGAAPAIEGKTGAYVRASAGFMGQEWDGGDVAFRPETWRAVFDRLKPGAHLVAFSGTRTDHRLVCAIEDAGFIIRDKILWAYGSGFPKSHSMSKAIDRMNGDARPVVGHEPTKARPNKENFAKRTDRQPTDKAVEGWKDNGATITAPGSDASAEWDGWGTALKPSIELICLAQKPISEKSIAANVLKWRTGALNIDGCRVEAPERSVVRMEHRETGSKRGFDGGLKGGKRVEPQTLGRWPANLVHDGSDEVVSSFPDSLGQQGVVSGEEPSSPFANVYGDMPNRAGSAIPRGDSGSAARFFYSAKAGPLDRLGSAHATVKPVDLMRWLCRMITPPGGRILDPFAGSGTTGIAALAEGFDCTMIELLAAHVADIERKLAIVHGEGRHRLVELHARRAAKAGALGGLFGEEDTGA